MDDSQNMSHFPNTILGGFDSSPGIRIVEMSSIGCVVHERVRRSDRTRVRSRNCMDWEGNGPAGRGKRTLVYNILQMVIS